jgi:hypothetical protein
MLVTSHMNRKIAFEYKIQLTEPLQNSKIPCKLLKILNSNNCNRTNIQEETENELYEMIL